MGFSFDNVEEVSAKGFTEPGTKGKFKIAKVEFENSKNKGTRGMVVTFEDKTSSFRHTFWMTEKALGRIQSLSVAATGEKLTGDVSEDALKKKLEGKFLGLKVTGTVSDSGKGYADVPFSGFCTSKDKVEELSFSAKEQGDINRALEAIRNAAPVNADKETDSPFRPTPATAGAPAPAGTAPVADDDEF